MTRESPGRTISSRIFNPYRLRPRALVLYHVLVMSVSIFTLDRIAAYAFLPEADSREILLVGSQTCPHSQAVKQRLVGAGIPFREVSAEERPVSRALASWAFQSLRVPIVVIGPEVIHGNRRARIDEALLAIGYGEPAPAPSAPL